MRFCGECGAALVEGAAPPTKVAERRLVSVVFADLVGFTSLSESRDQEEVRELLSRYFEACRRLIGIYGGTVEKFIGDAVMAVWGAPVAQEDDAERAVRAALDLLAAVAQLGEEVGAPELRLRAGVLTGEAAVTLGAAGEGMVAGDLVNTASRIQAAAEPGTVLVGEATKRATDSSIAYEPAGLRELKGKTEPVPLFRALRVTSVRGGALKTSELEPPFVGRVRELRLVKELFHATAEERKAHLVSVIGIAGIGKSRLAWEFEKYMDGVAEQVWWHRGRCLAYGDGVAYWALAEMVRMRALISDEDPPDAALGKLRAMLEERILDPGERAWLEPRLAQLVGLGEHAAGDRQELFSAWRLFFERLAEQGPVVLVFEDIQWADASLLDFVEHLLDWSRAHPIYVLALARPELAERHPGFGAGGRNATTLSLEPLSPAAMEELLDGLAPGLPSDLCGRILERAEGVPLYAVETVRMLLDRGLLTREADAYRPTGPIGALEVPETLHALVAARLDGLDAEERRVLQDAAVLGRSFTKAGLAALSGMDETELEPILTALIRKEVLSVQADPRSPERGQYGFLQDLLKRIAYETLARADRKARHLAAAEHLEQAWGSAEQEIVEVVAAHYLDAYETAPDAPDAPAIKAKAADRLALAGERAASLAASEEAQGYFEKAAALAGEPLRQAELLERAGAAAQTGTRYDASLALFEQSIELYEADGASHRAAHVAAQLGLSMWFAGDIRGGAERLEDALAVLADDQPDAEIAELVHRVGQLRFFLGELEAAADRVERALEIAESLFLPGVLVDALNTKHLLLDSAGRYEEAFALLERAITIGREHELHTEFSRALYNLSFQLGARDRVAEAMQVDLEGLELARRRGDRSMEQLFLGHLAWERWCVGEWEEAQATNEMLSAVGAHGRLDMVGTGVVLALGRGHLDEARRILAESQELRESDERQARCGFLSTEAAVLLAEGRSREALTAASEALSLRDISTRHPIYKWAWTRALEAAFACNDLDRVDALLADYDRMRPSERTPMIELAHTRFRARLLAQRGDRDGVEELVQRGVELARSLQMPFELAIALADEADWLDADGRTDKAEVTRTEARELFERLGAKPWLERLAAKEQAPAPTP